MLSNRFRWQDRLRMVIGMIVVWVLAIYFIAFIRSYGVERIGPPGLEGQFTLRRLLFQITVLGMLAGITFTLSEIFFDRAAIRKHSYGWILLLKAISYVILTKLILFVLVVQQSWVTTGEIRWELVRDILRSKVYYLILIYFSVVATFISFLRQVDQKVWAGHPMGTDDWEIPQTQGGGVDLYVSGYEVLYDHRREAGPYAIQLVYPGLL